MSAPAWVIVALRAGALVVWLAALTGLAGALLTQRALLAPLHVDAGSGSGSVEVVPGATIGTIAGELQSRGVLGDAWALRLYARLTGRATRIQAGEYALAGAGTPVGLLERMVSGDTVHHSVTLVEGWTVRQIRAALAAASPLVHTLAAVADAELLASLGIGDGHPEGRFFPDTYRYQRGHTDADILRRAHAAMRRYLDAAWARRAPDLPYASPYEALIMASIIEKETGVAGERARIAGVFVRRLRRGMKLQTDPTVIYGMGERYDGDIRRRDLREDTPYNTYVHAGLTPTPIASPGAAAIDAALHPAPGTSLYFVARGDDSGGHVFSDTYEQHQAAVARYLRRLRERRRAGS